VFSSRPKALSTSFPALMKALLIILSCENCARTMSLSFVLLR
jgi:D-tyrosyl-tRNA(Tyr) deacylase